jgi:hypothetical protein
MASSYLLSLLSFITPSSCFNPKNIKHNNPGDALGASADYTGKFATTLSCKNNLYFNMFLGKNYFLVQRSKERSFM